MRTRCRGGVAPSPQWLACGYLVLRDSKLQKCQVYCLLLIKKEKKQSGGLKNSPPLPLTVLGQEYIINLSIENRCRTQRCYIPVLWVLGAGQVSDVFHSKISYKLAYFPL